MLSSGQGWAIALMNSAAVVACASTAHDQAYGNSSTGLDMGLLGPIPS